MYPFLPPSCQEITQKKELQQFLSPKGVLYLVMNRPEVQNAFNGKQIENILSALENAEENEAVKVIVLTGAGKNFSAGGDIQYMRTLGENSFDENKADALRMALLMNRLNECSKPTIARVNGAAFGGGVGLLCCCDMAFGSAHTKVCLSEVKIGMVPATIGPYIIKAIGLRNAHRYMLSAEVLKAEEAVEANFLSGLFDQDSFDQDICTISEKVAANAPNALATTKTLIHNITYQPIDDDLIDYTADIIATARNSEEGKEGLSAFLEKRKPNFLILIY